MKKENYFTFILDYREGRYISQFQGFDVIEAFSKWVHAEYKRHDKKDFYNVNFKTFEEVMLSDRPTKISRVRNTWIQLFLLRRSLGILHIIKTDVSL